MLIDIFFLVIFLGTAVVFHEVAHGWVAWKLGDPTARDKGRLTLNPVKHVDPVGTLLLPGILIMLRVLGLNTFVFGWAKPVPVNFSRLRNPRSGMIYVALAGPFTNILLALAFAGMWHVSPSGSLAAEYLTVGIFINILLALFNMIPVPPLDGSRVVMGLMPRKWLRPYVSMERYGLLIVVLLISAGIFDSVLLPAIFFVMDFLGVSG